jgi:hypothetical protein
MGHHNYSHLLTQSQQCCDHLTRCSGGGESKRTQQLCKQIRFSFQLQKQHTKTTFAHLVTFPAVLLQLYYKLLDRPDDLAIGSLAH